MPSYDLFSVVRSKTHMTGKYAFPVQDGSGKVAIVDLQDQMEIVTIAWVIHVTGVMSQSTIMGPHPSDLDGKLVYLGGTVSTPVPIEMAMNTSGQKWALSGVYHYASTDPSPIGESDLPTGKTPWSVKTPQSNAIPKGTLSKTVFGQQ